MATWVRLLDRRTGKRLLFLNTHLDHVSEAARAYGAAAIAGFLRGAAARRPTEAHVLTGDLNAHDNSAAVRALLAAPLADSHRALHAPSAEERTAHGYYRRRGDRPQPTFDGRRIDYIFHSPQLAAQAASIDRFGQAEGRWPSDHHAVTATLLWQVAKAKI